MTTDEEKALDALDEEQEIEEKEGVCEFCGGTGEVPADETDKDGNVARGVDTQPCICGANEEEYEHA